MITIPNYWHSSCVFVSNDQTNRFFLLILLNVTLYKFLKNHRVELIQKYFFINVVDLELHSVLWLPSRAYSTVLVPKCVVCTASWDGQRNSKKCAAVMQWH